MDLGRTDHVWIISKIQLKEKSKGKIRDIQSTCVDLDKADAVKFGPQWKK